MELTELDFTQSHRALTPKLLAIAKQEGFYNGSTPYNDLFSGLFFHGGKLLFREDLQIEFKLQSTQFLKSFMGSMEPSHEVKEAICTLLLSRLVDIDKYKNKYS